MFEEKYLERILFAIEPAISNPDRFKQRAGAELIAGLLRGAKHWRKDSSTKLWDWFMMRIGQIFAQMKLDTVRFWESLFHASDLSSPLTH